MRLLLGLGCLAALTACGGGTVVASGGPDTTAPAGASLTVVLDPGGLGFATDASVAATPGATVSVGAVTQLSFATSVPSTVKAEIMQALGTVTATRNPTCALDQVTVGGFSAYFAAAQFVGWTDAGTAGPLLKTKDGLTIGTSLADLQKLRPNLVLTPTTASAAWSTGAGGLYGTLDGSDPSSTVTAVSAGQTCTPAPTPTLGETPSATVTQGAGNADSGGTPSPTVSTS